jgi:NADH-quinone oxidoreductase subunit E
MNAGRNSQSLAGEFRELADRYPDSRSALIPALRLAQEHYGYLTPEALREVAGALGTTPAYCRGVASFYDMFNLAPVGRHTIEICTNASCALVGAARVLEAFERELGITAGETTGDGAITLRSAECLGGCGRGTVVSIDHRYREPVTPQDVPGIIEELRRG